MAILADVGYVLAVVPSPHEASDGSIRISCQRTRDSGCDCRPHRRSGRVEFDDRPACIRGEIVLLPLAVAGRVELVDVRVRADIDDMLGARRVPNVRRQLLTLRWSTE